MTNSRPQIIVNQNDHEKLISLALRALGQSPAAPLLLEEMERADVVAPERMPAHVLAMGDGVEFEYDGSRYRDFRLVYPDCADFSQGAISVLTPVGAALIGLAEGQSMRWTDPKDRPHRLTVQKVQAKRG